MTDEERNDEADEAIEDLEAPAEQQEDVAGGYGKCVPGSCTSPSQACTKPTVRCASPTCVETDVMCTPFSGSSTPVVYEQ